MANFKNGILKAGVIFFILILAKSLNAQIIVVQAKQLTDTTKGFYGNADFNFNFTSNTTDNINGGVGTEVYYSWARNRLISLNNYVINTNVRETKSAFVNQGFQHLRFSHDFSYKWTGSVFTQIQTNRVLRIRQRTLFGAGPRLNINPFNKNSLMLGTLLMFEHENELDSSAVHNDLRLSTYLYYRIQFTESVKLSSITYYQPRLDLIKDFRISSSLDLIIALTEKVIWTIIFNLVYDAFPVVDPAIPNLTYSIQNGLMIRF